MCLISINFSINIFKICYPCYTINSRGDLMKDLKVVFMGTPSFSVPTLEGLIENTNVIAVVTQPDKEIGRHHEIKYSPIKEIALKHDIPVLQPEDIKTDYEEILNFKPDIIITCAYGQIIPKELLTTPKYKCINVHASLLPKLRGGAPIHRAIIEGHSKTGITIMYMASKMDAGDIISQREIVIEEDDTASTLHDKLSVLGRNVLLETLPAILTNNVNPIKQNESEVTYAWNISHDDERIHFNKTVREVYNHIRGLYSWPGAYCLYEGKILKVWKCLKTDNLFPTHFDGQITTIYKEGIGVKVSNGEIILTEVQPEGKKKMSAIDFVNGLKNKDELIGKILD